MHGRLYYSRSLAATLLIEKIVDPLADNQNTQNPDNV